MIDHDLWVGASLCLGSCALCQSSLIYYAWQHYQYKHESTYGLTYMATLGICSNTSSLLRHSHQLVLLHPQGRKSTQLMMSTHVSQRVGRTHYQVHWSQIAAVRAQKILLPLIVAPGNENH